WDTLNETVYGKGTCPTTGRGPWDDLPDGPTVEKGGVAEVTRKGNNPPITSTSPTWSPALRRVLTINAQGNGWSNKTLGGFSVATTGLRATLVKWVLGQDVRDENGNGNTSESRPSLHGDEIHSRPLPIDYGAGVVRVFYGSNDATLRAVDASSGQEL